MLEVLMQTRGQVVSTEELLERAVVLGSAAATWLCVDRAGEHVYISGRWFLVIGILDTIKLAPGIDRSALIGWPYAPKWASTATPPPCTSAPPTRPSNRCEAG
ncbi:hypothetical protein GCM10010160_34400 [Acrocarpospora corrugata]